MEKNTNLIFDAAKTIYEYPDTDKNCKAELVKMFPELEPEDEKFARIVLDSPFMPEADYKFVKAYLEKQKEQKSAEWSEEDRTMLETICTIIRMGVPVQSSAKEKIDWLKSRCFRYITYALDAPLAYDKDMNPIYPPINRWKPSEEQMKALKVVARGFPTDDPDAIDSLLTDLQKLL